MNKQLPNIFEYLNYRTYLSDYYNLRKKWDTGFTHTYICFRLGQRSSRSHFNNIVKGRKDISTTFIDRFIELLELKSEEAHYFSTLVNYNQAEDLHKKELYFGQLVKLSILPQKELEEESYRYYEKWYHATIRALLDIYDFSHDYYQLSQKIYPPITLQEAKDSIALLARVNLIAKNEDGFYKPVEQTVTTGLRANHQQIKQYQLQNLDLAKLAIMDEELQAFKSSTLTVSVSNDAYKAIIQRMIQFQKEIKVIVNDDKKEAEELYQINLHIFPQAT